MKLEEETRKDKKKIIMISSMSIAALLLIVGISYAFWQSTKIQENMNVIASGCFGVELVGNNPINLTNAYPITSEKGMTTTPYQFTITNRCSGSANYIVNLEALSNTTFKSESIRVAIDDTSKLYSEYSESEKYYEDSKETRSLISGTLEENESVTYNLRIWIDEKAPLTEQNKTFASKIVITTGEGEIIKSLADKVELGDYIRMTPTATSYIIPAGVTGYESSQEINPSELNLWRVIKKNDDGTVDVVSEHVSSETVTFKGKTGYLNYVGVLNQIAAQYTNAKYVQSTRHMGYNGQTEYITDTSALSKNPSFVGTTCTGWECESSGFTEEEEKQGAGDIGYGKDYNLVNNVYGSLVANDLNGKATRYWLSSRLHHLVIYSETEKDTNVYGKLVDENGNMDWDGLGGYNGSAFNEIDRNNRVRPILVLKAGDVIESGDGKSTETAYTFE